MDILRTMKDLETCLDAGYSLKDALKISHERAYQMEKAQEPVVMVKVLINGQPETFLGTINEGGMVKTPFWNRHLNKLHESVSLSPGWILSQVIEYDTLKTLWRNPESQI